MSDELIKMPVALVARETAGCRQYTFNSFEEMETWVARKPYCNERLLVIALHGRRMLGKKCLPARDAVAFVRNEVAAAREDEEVFESLAKTLMHQVEQESEQCAYWFVSALSKLALGKPHMRMPEVLEFVRQAMPDAARAYASYAKGGAA